MKAIVIREWSDPQRYPLEEVEIPTPGHGEVLIAVHTVGVVFGDMLISTGRYQVRPEFPFTPGSECSGTIEAVGSGVTGLKPGDKVAAVGFIGKSRETRRTIGACREKLVAPVRNVARVPDSIDLERAALFRSNTETSLYALQEGRLQADETLLVLGAGGGTGVAAVTLGKLMGARVIASASSPEKRAIAIAAGADIAVDSRAADWRAQIETIVGPSGVDVIYDPVGGDIADRAFRTLGYHGRYLVVGFAAGTIPKLALNLPLMKASSIIGANLLRGWEAEPDRFDTNTRYLMDLLAQDKVALPPVARRYKLAEAGAAYHDVAAGRTAGRVVISVAGS